MQEKEREQWRVSHLSDLAAEMFHPVSQPLKSCDNSKSASLLLAENEALECYYFKRNLLPLFQMFDRYT